MSTTKIYTIIVTYNGIKWIKECLDSVVKATNVIVVDNNSYDDTVSYIIQNYPDVVVFEQSDNLGFGKANNLGIAYALERKADYIFLLNQDARVFGNTINQLAQTSMSNPEYGILSPLHCDWTGEFLENSFSKYVSIEHSKDFYSDFVLSKQTKQVYDVPFSAAACWFLPKKVFETIGGFDPIFFHLGEDANFTQRIFYHGFKIGVLSNCKIGHDTSNRDIPIIKKYSNEYFYKKEYRLKVKFADVRMEEKGASVKFLKKKIYEEALISLIKLNLTNFSGALKEIKLLNKVKSDALASISINRNKGMHYLNIKS